MSFRIIQFEGLDVFLKNDENNISIFFENAHIKKTMDDAEEKTLWKQSGSIELRGISKKNNSIPRRLKILSINISYDFYTYKNILMLPFHKRGDIELILNESKENLDINCGEIEILLSDQPKYIKHIKKKE
tara:strand:+ start:1116 stop:1508 length:393 start_codon:yes stop_codon:yes gene_type:complete